MKRPYITCYMMISVDGRVDCAMTEKLPGVEEYYHLLEELDFDATVSGRVTAKLEIAEKGKFIPNDNTIVGCETVSNKTDSSKPFEIIVDTKGTLLWKDNSEYDEHILIITSEQVTKEYLAYLDGKGISYISTGKDKINLVRAMEIIKETFKIEKVGVVGGPAINTSFLDAGLLDEVVILIGAGIDGRSAFPPVFNRNEDKELTPLMLIDVKAYDSGAVCIRYNTK